MNEPTREEVEAAARAMFTAGAEKAGTGETWDLAMPGAREWYQMYARAALAAAREVRSEAVPPGPCWVSAGVVWPGGFEPRCELRAGHAGAHECDRGAMGGTAVWTSEDAPASRPEATIKAEALREAARDLLAFDCLDAQIPWDVDVPADYEIGMHEAGKVLLARADEIDEGGDE